MQWSSLLAFALVVPQAYAFLRFECSQLVVQRLDPLVTPGEVSPHLHQIVGGNAFNVSMHPELDLPKLATCTTCTFKEDLSNYWTAVLYFRAPNGSFKRVPQMPNQFLQGNGGMTVYYNQPMDNTKVTAFKKGFRMIVGDPMIRSFNNDSTEARMLSYRCFDTNFGGNPGNQHPGTGLDTHTLPNRVCNGGIRANTFFPSCWDGKNLDSPDHKSHMAWETGGRGLGGGPFQQTGKCPSTHPVRMPQLFFETVWDTRGFNSMFPKDGSQPFVYSNGDPNGLGHHGDYVFGWKDNSLQTAMDKCTGGGNGCTSLTSQTTAQINSCTQKARVMETVDGWLPSLPGCNPVQNGPGRAEPGGNCGATTTFTL
jgi:hypothetical protein